MTLLISYTFGKTLLAGYIPCNLLSQRSYSSRCLKWSTLSSFVSKNSKSMKRVKQQHPMFQLLFNLQRWLEEVIYPCGIGELRNQLCIIIMHSLGQSRTHVNLCVAIRNLTFHNFLHRWLTVKSLNLLCHSINELTSLDKFLSCNNSGLHQPRKSQVQRLFPFLYSSGIIRIPL